MKISPSTNVKKKLATEFEMKDLGMMHYFLGLEVWKYLDEIFPKPRKIYC